ncbi:FBXL2, partial [Symbiodinium necroappetens]
MHTRAAGGKCKGNDEDASKVAVNVRETSDEELGEGRGPKSRRGPEGSPRDRRPCWTMISPLDVEWATGTDSLIASSQKPVPPGTDMHRVVIKEDVEPEARVDCGKAGYELKVAEAAIWDAFQSTEVDGALAGSGHKLDLRKAEYVCWQGLLANVEGILQTLGLAYCHGTVTDEVASELLFQFGLQALDLSFCSQLSDAPFEAHPHSLLRELRLSSTNVSDRGLESIARRAPNLEVVDVGWAMKLTDSGILSLVTFCSKLQALCVRSTEITDASFEAIMQCQHLERLNASWCLRATAHALDILADTNSVTRPPLKSIDLDHLGAIALDIGLDAGAPLPALPMIASTGQWESSASLSPLPPNWCRTQLNLCDK